MEIRSFTKNSKRGTQKQNCNVPNIVLVMENLCTNSHLSKFVYTLLTRSKFAIHSCARRSASSSPPRSLFNNFQFSRWHQTPTSKYPHGTHADRRECTKHAQVATVSLTSANRYRLYSCPTRFSGGFFPSPARNSNQPIRMRAC